MFVVRPKGLSFLRRVFQSLLKSCTYFGWRHSYSHDVPIPVHPAIHKELADFFDPLDHAQCLTFGHTNFSCQCAGTRPGITIISSMIGYCQQK